MRWPWRRGALDAKKLPSETGPKVEDLLRSKAAPGLDGAVHVGGAGSEALAASTALPRPVSIFEFGPPVAAGGEYLRGMCAGDNPDAIQACEWSLETLEGKERKPVYHIEF